MTDSVLNAPGQCSLHEWAGLHSRLLFAFERALLSGDADGSYIRHSQYGAVLIRSGRCEIESEGERVVARPGQWVFSFTHRHRQQFSHDSHVLALRMANNWPDDVMMFRPVRKLFVIDADSHPEIERLAVQFVTGTAPVEVRQENPIYTYTQRTRLSLSEYVKHQKLLMDWLALMSEVLPQYGVSVRYPHGIDLRLSKALDLIDGLPLAEVVPAQKLEKSSGLTLQQLDRLCRRSFGMTTRQYWDKRRLDQVKFRLRHPAAGVKEVAVAAGFTQLSHFSAWFKRHTRMSPRTYREMQLGEEPSE